MTTLTCLRVHLIQDPTLFPRGLSEPATVGQRASASPPPPQPSQHLGLTHLPLLHPPSLGEPPSHPEERMPALLTYRNSRGKIKCAFLGATRSASSIAGESQPLPTLKPISFSAHGWKLRRQQVRRGHFCTVSSHPSTSDGTIRNPGVPRKGGSLGRSARWWS